MNRKQRRQIKREVDRNNRSRPSQLSRVKEEDIPQELNGDGPGIRTEVWHSKDYLVQVFLEEGGIERLSICRTSYDSKLQYISGITWDELQQIKRDIGRGNKYAIEIYPRDIDIVDVANMRHLWVLPEPLDIGWMR